MGSICMDPLGILKRVSNWPKVRQSLTKVCNINMAPGTGPLLIATGRLTSHLEGSCIVQSYDMVTPSRPMCATFFICVKSLILHVHGRFLILFAS